MLPPGLALPIAVVDPSHIGHARRKAIALAAGLGFSETQQGQIGVIVTEAAANIAAHAGEGELVIIPWRFDQRLGIDVFALDRGRGISDIGRSLEDGYSTAGTAGQGLGAISRMSSAFQIYSVPGGGTALFARLSQDATQDAEGTTAAYEVGAISVPLSGETLCGDAWAAAYTPGRSVYIVADGLGHGPMAAEAAQEAVRIFDGISHYSPERILEEVHQALAKTRGAAVSVAEILHEKAILNYSGIGNIAGAIYTGGKNRSMITMNGTVGHSIGRIQSFPYPYDKDCTLILHSDGLGTRWSMEQYPGLASRHPALIAGILYRDFSRRRDDVTILVSRI